MTLVVQLQAQWAVGEAKDVCQDRSGLYLTHWETALVLCIHLLINYLYNGKTHVEKDTVL